MILHNTTYNVLFEAETSWFEWMKARHLPALRGTPGVAACTFLRLLTEIDNGGSTYTVQVRFTALDAYEQFLLKYNPSLQDQITAGFPNQFVSFQTTLKEV